MFPAKGSIQIREASRIDNASSFEGRSIKSDTSRGRAQA
jgi:hypothetical protein